MLMLVAGIYLQPFLCHASLRSARKPSEFSDRYLAGKEWHSWTNPAPNASSNNATRHVILAKHDEDVAWLHRLPVDYEVVVYQSLDPAAPLYIENFGNEAAKYLSYIVEHYDDLPDSMMFLHAGQQDWHDPLAKEVTLGSWDWDAAVNSGGMVSLPTAAPCLIEDASNDPGVASHHWAAQPRCNGIVEHMPKQMAALKEAWPTVFEDELGHLPKRWLTHCCAQFEVTGAAVKQHSKEFYNGLFHWVMRHDQQLLEADADHTIRRNHDPDRKDAGHIMEIAWVLIFAMNEATSLQEPHV